ncbi:DUF1631 family protein [Marinimicrobium locisalis]|uniref:DUF1631 family protein n=1 Tax=Marinimicrobium locisalis TaxID=546022 RepID=UPI0032216EFC
MTDPEHAGTDKASGDPNDPRLAQHLKHCRHLAIDYARRFLPIFWRQWCERLGECAERARSNTDATSLLECKRLLEASQYALEEAFCQQLGNGFDQFKNKQLKTLAGEERFSGSLLSRVEPSDLEETIAITSITHRADGCFSGPLWLLHQRMALLNGGEKIAEPGNPVSPVQFCEALRTSLLPLALDNRTRVIGFKVFDKEVIAPLGELYEVMNRYFVEVDLLANLRYTAASEPSSKRPAAGASAVGHEAEAPSPDIGTPQRRASDRLLSGMATSAGTHYQAGLYNAIRLLQGHLNHLVEPDGDAEGAAPPTNGTEPHHRPRNLEQLVSLLHDLQVLALTQSQGSGSEARPLIASQPVRQVSEQVLEQLATGSEGSDALAPGDLYTIDLVELLFEYMLFDDNLPDSVKALLSYLHTPFLKLAFIDTDFFEQTNHPARVLLNSLAEAGARWVSNDGTCQYDMYNKIKTTVFGLLAKFNNDPRLFAEVLVEFNAYTVSVARRQELTECRALEKVQGEEKLREAKQRVNDEVRQRTDNRELPSAVLLLLLQPWSDYLSFVILRYGESSNSWHQCVKVMDQLLWTLDPKTRQGEKARQREIQGNVLRALQAGLDNIGYDQAKGKKLLEAVAALQRMALQSRRAEPAPEPMRSRLESIAAGKAGRSRLTPEPVTEEEQKVVEDLKLIEFGTWFEYESHRRLKVAWYHKRTLHYMLVDQQGRKVAMSSALQLARDMIAGRARIIHGSTQPFFERALENIYQQLNAKAGGESAEEAAHG